MMSIFGILIILRRTLREDTEHASHPMQKEVTQ